MTSRHKKLYLSLIMLFILVFVVGWVGITNVDVATTFGQVQDPEPAVMTTTLLLPESLFQSPITWSGTITAIVNIPAQLTRAVPLASVTQYIPVCLTGSFTLLAASLGLIVSYLTSKAARRYEWGKFLWDKNQEQYLGIRNAVRGSLDPSVIEAKLESSRASLALPHKLDQELIKLLTNLRDKATLAEKEKARAEFLLVYDAFISRPWEYL